MSRIKPNVAGGDSVWHRRAFNQLVKRGAWSYSLVMIARLWHGYATPAHADAYEALLKPELLPGVSTKKGYRGSHLLRRNAGDEVEFITILFFDTLDDIKALTGPDFETAVIPAERRQYLSRFDAEATHYDMPATHGLQHPR